jgi:hypothetical protein
MILLSSCGDKKEHAKKEDVDTFTLQGVNMILNDPSFLFGRLIDLQDSILYVESRGRDTIINIYVVKGDSLNVHDRFLTRGNGPYEVNVFANVYDRATKTLSFFENYGKLTKGYQVDVKTKNGIHDKSTWRVFDFSPIGDINMRHSFAYVSDTLLLAIGGKFYSQELLTLINLNNCALTYSLDFWPDDGSEENNLVKQKVYIDNAHVFKNSKLNRYLYVSDWGKYMEIFSIEDKQVTHRLPVCTIYPKYKAAEDGINYSLKKEEINYGFYVYTTDSLIYARPVEVTLEMLRSGQGVEGYDRAYSRIIDVYNWNGNLIKRYETDIPFHSFVVDEENNFLYVLTNDLETEDTLIRKYNLSAGENKKDNPKTRAEDTALHSVN